MCVASDGTCHVISFLCQLRFVCVGGFSCCCFYRFPFIFPSVQFAMKVDMWTCRGLESGLSKIHLFGRRCMFLYLISTFGHVSSIFAFVY